MASKSNLKELFEVESKLGAFFTGRSVELTSNGKLLLCQCGPSINILDIESGQLIGCLGNSEDDDSIDSDDIVSFALSADDQHVLSSHRSGLFRLWHLEAKKVMKVWKSIHKGPVAKLALTTNGSIMASGGSDSSVRLWDLVHQSCTHNLGGIHGVVSVLHFHPDKARKLLLGAADDAAIVGWNVETGKPVLTLKGHFSRVCAMTIHTDGKHVISCGRDKVVILWDLDKQSAVNTIPLYEGLEGLVLLPSNISLPGVDSSKINNMCVAVAGERGVVRVWDVSAAKEVFIQTNSLVSKAKEEGSLAITQLVWNPNFRALGIITVEHNIIFHKVDNFECIKQFVGFSDEILDVAYMGVGTSHLAVATNSMNVALYRILDMSCSLLRGHTDLVLGLATSRVNPNLLVSCAKDYSVRVWCLTEDGAAATCVGLGQRHTAAVGSVFCGQLSSELVVSAGQDKCIKVWKLPSKWSNGTEIATLNAVLTQIAHQKDINSICVSPNDKLIATGSQDKTSKIWSVQDLSLVGVLRGHRRGVWCVRFSPADQMLLTTSADCTMRLWSLQDLSCIKTFEGHDSSVVRGEFLTSGTQLVSGGADGLLKLWTVKSGECTSTLDQHNGRIWGLSVSMNEQSIVTGGTDSVLVRWKDVTDEKKKAALAESEKLTLEEQQLANLIHNNELLKALKLALRLKRPHHSLNIIRGVLKKGDIAGLNKTVSHLNKSQQEDLMKYAILWNSNGKHCYTAQALLSVLLEQISSGKLQVEGLRSILEGLLPYTDRHMRRLSELQQDLHFLAFTANCMQPHAS